MNSLNDLIERLYLETCPDDDQPALTVAEPSSASVSDQTLHLARLRRVATEMAALLRQEDQPIIPQQAPDEAITLRILNHWEAMTTALEGIRLHMQSLDQDIVRMQPWGNFDVMKVEQLASRGVNIRFWTLPVSASEDPAQQPFPLWGDNCHLIAQDADFLRFVTVTTSDGGPTVPAGAREVELCPCPVSTLIMLQTRDKDSIRRQETLLGDYALVHYGEVYSALRALLPPGTPLPELSPEHPGIRQRLALLLHNKR